MEKSIKTSRQTERHIKGIANHRRIDILFTIAANAGVTVEGIADILRCNVKTISEHTRRLTHAGLVDKKYQGRSVAHTLSPYGKTFHAFLKSFRYS